MNVKLTNCDTICSFFYKALLISNALSIFFCLGCINNIKNETKVKTVANNAQSFSYIEKKELKSEKIEAIIREDNDFVTFNDSLSKRNYVPEIVSAQISNLKENTNEYHLERYGENCPVFQIESRKGISLYIVKLSNFYSIRYYLIAFNAKLNIITKEPTSINGKWMEENEKGFLNKYRLLDKPLISFKDINLDGKDEVIIKERVHNGTVYNAVITNYYSLDEKMNFQRVLSIESKYLTLNEHCIIHRSLRDNKIIVELKCNNSISKKIGNVEINLTDSTSIVYSELYIKEYKNLLITGSGIPDQVFLNNGYSFEY